MALRQICRVEDVPPGQTRFFHIEGTPLILANWSGQIFALHGLCPHKQNPLDGARLWPYPGGYLVDCPWHHFQYDVRTGESFFPKNVYPEDLPHLQQQLRPLKTYPVEMRGSEIWVDLE